MVDLPVTWRGWAGVLLAGMVLACAVAVPARAASFESWLEGVKREAAAKGVSEATLERAFAGLQPIPRVLELDRRQPEFTRTFWGYLDRAVDEQRIARGRALLARHRALLERVRARYGVQPRFLVAFWGLESNYGSHIGGFPVIGALATLAHDTRRSAFFRAQLLQALLILEQDRLAPAEMQGSWAGAMGQLQFLPTTFADHAVDFDGDGRRDIWGSLPDVFASAASYLSRIGWRGDELWGREVRLPADFDWELASSETSKPIAEWQRLGVRRADGRELPQADMAGSVILPAGHKGPAFLVYGNFARILDWNRSTLYALAVGHLSDRLIGKGPLLAARPAEDQPLSRAEVEEMQTLLAELGFQPGDPDGMVGSQTRAALRAFQRRERLAPDGYPTPELLAGLRAAAARAQ